MTGITRDEGAMISPSLWKEMDPSNNVIKDNWGYIGTRTLFPSSGHDMSYEKQALAHMVAHFYVGEGGLQRDNIKGVTDMLTDAYFAAPNTETVKLLAKAPPPVYNYLFTYQGSFSMTAMYTLGDPQLIKQDWGVAHGDDAPYLARIEYNGQKAVVTEEDQKMVEIMQKLISNFVRYGDPTPVEYDHIPKWKPAQDSRAACIYMELNLNPAEKHMMFRDRMTFWNLLQFREDLEEYAVDVKEADMLVEIENAIEDEEHEDDDDEDDDDHKEDVSSESNEDDEQLSDKDKMKKRRRRIRWIRRNKMKKISRPGRKARQEARKQRKLAKKMRSMV